MSDYDDSYYDDDEFGAGGYPPRHRRPRWRRRPVRFKWLVAAFLVMGLISLRFCGGGRQRPREGGERTEVVTVMDWTAVDTAVRRGMEQAYTKAEAVARAEVRAWIRELQVRIDDDFLPLWFGYLYQQSVALKAAKYWCMDTPFFEGVFGRQESVEERLERLVEREFNSRVLQPKSAQLRIEKIMRRTVSVYIHEMQESCRQVQVKYQIRDQDFARYLGGVPESVLGLDANRRVPLVLKGVTVGSGAAALKLGRSVITRVQEICLRHFGRELIEGGAQMGGRMAAKGTGGWIVGGVCLIWDLADHHKTRTTNLPVMRRSLSTFLQELEEQVLTDQRCGVLTTLDMVELEIIQQLESGRK